MLNPFEVAWDVLKGDAFHPSVTGFRTAARRGFSQPPMMDEATFAEDDNHAERMPRPSPEQERYDSRYEEQERDKENRYNMEMAQRAMESEKRRKRMDSPDIRDALERLGF